MIVVVGGIKGGSGKTTVSTNLVSMRAAEGRDVLLVDADDQESATDFTNMRNELHEGEASYTSIKLTGPAVRTETQRMVSKYDDIIIDTGGRDTTSQRAALTVAEVLLVPFIPRSFDVWTLEKVSDLVGEMKAANPSLRVYAFINRADPRGQDNKDAEEIIKETPELEFIRTPLGNRKAFSNAAAKGLGVVELRPEDPKASEEISVLFKYVFNT